MPTWVWQRWHQWFYDYNFLEEMLPDQLGDRFEFTGGEGYVVGITEDELAACRPAVEQLLEAANGDAAIALIMAAHHLDAAIAYILRRDVEGILGFAISDEEWPRMKETLAHYDQHITVCCAPLVHVFVRDAYDKLHEVENWQEHPPLQPLLAAVRQRKWQLTGG